MKSSQDIVQSMMAQDAFSQWLGIEVLSVTPGSSKLQMAVRKQMTNGFGIAHGGITYSFADSALAFASNSYGNVAVSIETQISHISPVSVGDVLIAETKEVSKSAKLAVYEVEVSNQHGKVAAHFKGTVFIKKELHK
jgi:acyl-CoA thioesterase